MTINWTAVDSVLEKALGIVSEISPIASAAGPVGATAGEVISKLASFASEALQAAQNESVVLDETDLAAIEAAQKTLQAANDLLAAQIAIS